jgi:hypothetical protein
MARPREWFNAAVSTRGGYSAAVTAPVRACTPVLYVADLPTSAAFYELLGYRQLTSGNDDDWRYTYLKCGDHPGRAPGISGSRSGR